MSPNYTALCEEIKAEFPKFSVVKKGNSWVMRFLSHVFGPAFLTNYTTTIVNTVHVPDGWDAWDEATKCAVLRHERVHMRQSRKLTYPVFAFLYLFVFFPLGLSYCRARFEMEAYAESLAAFKDYNVSYTDKKAWLVGQFTGPAYGYMWPFPKTVSAWFDRAAASLR